MRTLAALLLASLASAAPASAKTMVAVTTCGQVVPKGAIGYLTGDLVCNGFTAAPGAIVLDTNATLDLRGFTLTTDDVFGVYCGGLTEEDGGVKACGVKEGTITGPTGHGVIGRRVRASNLVITGAGVAGIAANGPLKADGLNVSGCGEYGVLADTVRVSGSTFTGNGITGVVSGKGLRMLSSSATGNGTNPECSQGAPHCSDLWSHRRPVLKDSTCDTSLGKPFNQGGTDWDVCTLD
jgi:hypothetical protein